MVLVGTDSVARTTDLLASNGTNVVLAAVVTLFLVAVLATYVQTMRVRLAAETEERKLHTEERRIMFSKMFGGDGNGKGAITELKDDMRSLKTSVHRIGQVVEELPCQAEQIPCPVVIPIALREGAVSEAG